MHHNFFFLLDGSESLTGEELQEFLGRARPREAFHLHDVHLLPLWLWFRLVGRQRRVFILAWGLRLEDGDVKYDRSAMHSL